MAIPDASKCRLDPSLTSNVNLLGLIPFTGGFLKVIP